MANQHLHTAAANKNDEFYTDYQDISSELSHYKEYFKDKIVYCNCDDYEWSNFYRFFYQNFEILGLKKLVATCCALESVTFKFSEKQLRLFFEDEKKGKAAEVTLVNGIKQVRLWDFKDTGDFRTLESQKILQDSDIVVTNPPFSLKVPFLELDRTHQLLK